jgi:hypothetical protein
MKGGIRGFAVAACVLWAIDLFMAVSVDGNGELFGLPAAMSIAAYLIVAGLLLVVLLRLMVPRRRYWPLVLLWVVWHAAMVLPAC